MDQRLLFGKTAVKSIEWKRRILLSSLARWIIVLIVTVLGALWLACSGPYHVIRITTTLEEITPFWYQMTAFPILGMLLADLAAIFALYGLSWIAVELGAQIAILILASHFRLVLSLPVSGHALLFAYFLLRRAFIRIPEHRTAWIEAAVAGLFFCLIACAKIFWWTDPITIGVGILIAGCLALLSKFVLSGLLHRTGDVFWSGFDPGQGTRRNRIQGKNR